MKPRFECDECDVCGANHETVRCNGRGREDRPVSQFTKRVRQRMGWRAWFKVWWIIGTMRLGIRKPTPPRYDAVYQAGIDAFDD